MTNIARLAAFLLLTVPLGAQSSLSTNAATLATRVAAFDTALVQQFGSVTSDNPSFQTLDSWRADLRAQSDACGALARSYAATPQPDVAVAFHTAVLQTRLAALVFESQDSALLNLREAIFGILNTLDRQVP